MNTPALGFEEDSYISKQEIAQTQLTEAISLYLQGKFARALTLAIAAEGALAGLFKADGEDSAVKDSKARITSLLNELDIKIIEPKKDTTHQNEWDKTRNALKHHNENNLRSSH